jgi:hypothetical protein
LATDVVIDEVAESVDLTADGVEPAVVPPSLAHVPLHTL